MLSLLFLVLLFFQASPQSQSPSPAPAKPSQKKQANASPKQNKPANDQQVSDALTTAINKLAAEIAAREKQTRASPQENESSGDWWSIFSAVITALATACIAILGYRQWRSMQQQADYMKKGLEETRKAADAARDSADAFMQGERASVLVFCKEGKVEFPSEKYGVLPTIKNFGKTTANITAVQMKRVILPVNGRLPPVPTYDDEPDKRTYPIHPSREIAPCTLWISTGEMARLLSQQFKLWIHGFVEYRDCFGRPHQTKFCIPFEIRPGEKPGEVLISAGNDGPEGYTGYN